MREKGEKILAKALQLPPIERAMLVEQLFSSFDGSNKRKTIDLCWSTEIEGRIDAYDRGELSASPAELIFKRIRD